MHRHGALEGLTGVARYHHTFGNVVPIGFYVHIDVVRVQGIDIEHTGLKIVGAESDQPVNHCLAPVVRHTHSMNGRACGGKADAGQIQPARVAGGRPNARVRIVGIGQ